MVTFSDKALSSQVVSSNELCAHQIFEARVERNPNAVAIVYRNEQVSYQELNLQANRLAHYLSSCGVGPETLVALLAERSIAFAVAMLAIFKAGGAYLPLDPQHPEARQRQVIEQSRCQFVLSTVAFVPALSHMLSACPAEVRPRSICLEEALSSSQKEENLPAVSTPRTLAYVIYTSGSTGLPKGAMVEQRGMLNHLWAKIEALELSAADTVAQTASQCFDISVWQFLAALLVGGRVQIYPDVIAHDALQLLQQVEQQKVSILETVPALLRAMLDVQEDGISGRPQLEMLRWLIPTGEALPVGLCRRWLQRYPHIPMLNAYGPTECSDDVTHYVISQPPEPHLRSIPIGRAIRNIRLYVLDENLRQLSVGESGELYVGGIGVGRGYLGDELRTSTAFIADPFVPTEGARLYKTGDLARYLPDGNLEFIGRRDTQVKIRGYRIELGEIEAVLNQLDGVKEAAVAVREEEPGDKRLVAYMVLRRSQAITTEEIRQQLKKLVPAYMVPATFVLLEKLPLTNNGKLDRAALPAPGPMRRETEESYVAPTLPLHRQLVAIWEEVLGVRPIGIKDDFFELGGDSLLAVKLFERIEQECGKKLELATLFAGASVEQVAQAFDKEIQMDMRAPLVVVRAEGSRRPFFFLHGQWRGGAFYSLELARHLGTEQPFYLLEPYKFDGLAVPPTLEGMAAAHITTLRQIQPEGPYLLGGWCNGGLIAYEMARQLNAHGQIVELLVLMDSDAPAPRFKWDRRIIAGMVNLLRLGKSKQLDWFLVYRHLRLSFHYWRLHKGEHTKTARQDEPGPEADLADAGVQHETMIPTSASLRQDWIAIYDWIAAGYLPHAYAGDVTFFWTDEEPRRREGWQRLIEAKVIVAEKVNSHIIPGNHITSRTRYLSILAEHLHACLDKVQLQRLCED